MSKVIKVNWQDEELDIYYKKNGYPKSVWKDNEGLPFGVQSEYENEWFKTEQERDQIFKENENESCWINFNVRKIQR